MNDKLLWEENALTEPAMKFASKPISAPSDGISETSNASVKIECEDTGNGKVWIRKCPECQADIVCNDKWYYEDANRRGRLCKRCRITGKRNPNNGKLKERDVLRMNEIHQHLKCDFYRIDGRTLEIRKWL